MKESVYAGVNSLASLSLEVLWIKSHNIRGQCFNCHLDQGSWRKERGGWLSVWLILQL